MHDHVVKHSSFSKNRLDYLCCPANGKPNKAFLFASAKQARAENTRHFVSEHLRGAVASTPCLGAMLPQHSMHSRGGSSCVTSFFFGAAAVAGCS